ncbi:MAG: hypothetical protein ABIH66_02610 [bacterium]
MARCIGCGKKSVAVAQILGVCGECLVREPERFNDRVEAVHAARAADAAREAGLENVRVGNLALLGQADYD